MAFVVRNDLNNFLSKLDNIKKNGLTKAIIQKIADKGVEFAKEEYLGTNITVESSILDNKITISAKGKEVAYIEFGTGLVGEISGYPKEKLPKETLSFESPKGVKQSTQGWEYYYDNPRTKIMGGWFFGKTYTQGKEAGMQMFNTTKRIVQYCNKELAKEIRKGE